MVKNSNENNENNEKPEESGQPDEAATPRPRRRRRRRGRGKRASSPFAHLTEKLMAAGNTGSGGTAKEMGAVSDILALMLGSVPSFAAGETMLSASNYQSAMMANSVANQQRMNMIAMAATSGCVEQLLRMRPDRFWPDGDDDHDHDHEGGSEF